MAPARATLRIANTMPTVILPLALNRNNRARADPARQTHLTLLEGSAIEAKLFPGWKGAS
jgi:hypothetical protein